MTPYKFDDNNINWQQLDGFNNFSYSILNIDEKEKIVDVLYKFNPNEPIVLHRHRTPNYTFVVQGEHLIFEPDGTLKESRPVGSFTVSAASADPHRECGGEEGAIVLFSMRESEGTMYELLDDDENVIAALGLEDFKGLYQAGLAS